MGCRRKSMMVLVIIIWLGSSGQRGLMGALGAPVAGSGGIRDIYSNNPREYRYYQYNKGAMDQYTPDFGMLGFRNMEPIASGSDGLGKQNSKPAENTDPASSSRNTDLMGGPLLQKTLAMGETFRNNLDETFSSIEKLRIAKECAEVYFTSICSSYGYEFAVMTHILIGIACGLLGIIIIGVISVLLIRLICKCRARSNNNSGSRPNNNPAPAPTPVPARSTLQTQLQRPSFSHGPPQQPFQSKPPRPLDLSVSRPRPLNYSSPPTRSQY